MHRPWTIRGHSPASAESSPLRGPPGFQGPLRCAFTSTLFTFWRAFVSGDSGKRHGRSEPAPRPLRRTRSRLIEYPPWRCGWFVPSRHPDVWLTSRLPVVRGSGFRTRCQRQGVAVVWLERGASAEPWNQTCPPRSLHPRTKGAVMAVMIGVDPHKGSHTAVALDDERAVPRRAARAVGRQSGRAADGLGGPVRGADVGDRGCRRARLSVGPAARRRRRAGRRCATEAGRPGAAVGHRGHEQERPQRRPLGGRRRAALTERAGGPRRGSRQGDEGVGETSP